MKRLLLSAVALGVLCGSAVAQVNVVPQVGVVTGYLQKATYSSAFFGLVPVTAGTDVVCISGSATKTVKVQRVTIYGTVATTAQTLPVNLLRRASVDTGGTAATTTANPGVVTQISRRDPNITSTATATLVSYTANPTIVDAAPTYIDSQLMSMPLLAGATTIAPVDFNFSRDIENLLAVPTLYGVAQQVCVNINGVTLTNAAAWNGSIVWTEE